MPDELFERATHHFSSALQNWATTPVPTSKGQAKMSLSNDVNKGIRYLQTSLNTRDTTETYYSPKGRSLEVKLPTIWTDEKAEVGTANQKKRRRKNIREEK
jgi:hypothetical protein